MTLLGEARTYDELIALFRRRCAELGTSLERLDDIAGLPARYMSKLLAPQPVKGIGRVSLGPLLGALGLVLAVNVDAVAFERVKRRLIRNANAGSKMLARNGHGGFSLWANNPDLARLIRKRQALKQSKRKRYDIAKNAANVRWSKR